MTDGETTSTATKRSFTYNDLDQTTTETTSYAGGPQNMVLSYGFYADGSLRQRGTPAGTFGYVYDAGGRLQSLTNPYGETSSWT